MAYKMKRDFGKGAIKIGEHSSLRKLMRAARRGKVPQERIGICMRAMETAQIRARLYVNQVATKALAAAE